MIGVDRHPSIPLVVAATPAPRPHHACLSVQDVGTTAAGKPGAVATTCRAATFGSETPQVDDGRSNLLGFPPERLERVEERFNDCQSGHGCGLAPEGIPLVLEVEDSSRQARSAKRPARGSGTDSDDEPQQPTLGCTADSWRAAEVGHRHHRTDSREIHGAASKASFTDLAHVPGESHQKFGVGGLLCCANDAVRDPLRVSRAGTQPETVPPK